MTPITRQRTEAIALAPFKAIAEELGFKYTTGQSGGNRLPIKGGVYFQFGDLRIEGKTHTLVVEVESAGGVTNLAKYWESIEEKRVVKPIKLLHVFLQKSANDYEAHLLLWGFLAAKMQASLGSIWQAECVRVRGTSEECLAPALAQYRQWLNENAG